MKRAFLIFCILLVSLFCLVIVWIFSRNNSFIDLGSANLGRSGSINLECKLRENHQPWRIQFSIFPALSNSEKVYENVEVFLENLDTRPLVIYLYSENSNISISPKSKKSIFNGDISDLQMFGKYEYDDLKILSTKERNVQFQFSFVASNPSQREIRVSAWYPTFGP